MRRFPFYAYPNSPSYHRPHRPFSPASSSPARPPTPTPRSVINVPVFDSAPSRPSSSPPKPPLIDPSSAATTIQSYFRGFCVRRHHPLLHLRSISRARKQLQELQSELERSEFPLKVRASEKERLRFSESVMALILLLDAIEGSIAEVRSQRKEATKMAVKLQDAIDAIMIQKDEVSDLHPTADEDGMVPNEGGMAPSDDSVLVEQPQEPLHPKINMVQGETHVGSTNGILDVNTLQEKLISVDNVVDRRTPNPDNNNVMDMVVENVSPLHPFEMEDSNQHRAAGLGCIKSDPPVQPAKSEYDAEQDISHVTAESAGSDATLKNGMRSLCLETHKDHMQNHLIVSKVDHVDDMMNSGDGPTEREFTDGSYPSMDVVEVGQDGISQAVELCPGTPTAEEKCNSPHFRDAVHGNKLQGPLTSLESLTDGNCSLDGITSLTLHRHGHEVRSNESHEDHSNEPNSCDEVKAQTSTMSIAGAPSSQDNAILHQLSEDCRQLKSLVGKLVLQNKAQSNILCVLGERLEMLERQQQLISQHNQQKMREKRKMKKGAKRSVKCRNCEWKR